MTMLNNIIVLMEIYLEIHSNRNCPFNNERITLAENGGKMAI